MKLLYCIFFLIILAPSSFSQETFYYTSPKNNSKLVSLETNIILKSNEIIENQNLSNKVIEVTGSESGSHSGELILSDDNKTLVFNIDNKFTANENVIVKVNPGIKTAEGEDFIPLSLKFQTTPLSIPLRINPLSTIEGKLNNQKIEINTAYKSFPKKINLDSLPSDFPEIIINNINNPSDEKIFIANFPFGSSDSIGNFLMIVDNDGTVLNYKKLDHPTADFKIQPNGNLSYAEIITNKNSYADVRWILLDTALTAIDTFQCGNGYIADLHDFIILPNGHALLVSYDTQPVDMSLITEGGDPNANVTGAIIQELDVSKNVIFQWRSWDYIPIEDSYADLTTPTIDYVHINAVALDKNENILASFRHLSQIIKINRENGDIIWRLGGKQNEFTFINENESNSPNYFSYQHHISVLNNENITLFDNGTQHSPQYSRAVEYKLDEENKTAELIWEYRHSPDIYTFAMGSVQRLTNGNTIIGWGSASAAGSPVFTEVHPDNSVAFELFFPAGQTSYRAYRFPWKSKLPKAEVTINEIFAGNTYTFDETGDTTGVTIKFNTLSGLPYNSVKVSLYNYAPQNPEFSGNVPIAGNNTIKINGSNIDSYTGDLQINLLKYPQIKSPGEILIYFKAEDSTNYISIPTNFDSSTNELSASINDFGDFIFGKPIIIDSAYAPVPFSPQNNEIVNGSEPLKLLWRTRGIVQTYHLQISSDSLFNNLIIDDLNINSTSYIVSSLANNQKYFWRINTLNKKGISPWSDPFSFSTSLPFLNVSFPNGNEILINDSIYIIRWDDNISEGVKLELLKNNVPINTIADSVFSETNAFQWELQTSIENDSLYKIRITSLENPALFDISDNVFQINDGITGINNENEIIKAYKLFQNYPNPFNPSTTIRYSILEKSYVKLSIFNSIGQKIHDMVNSVQDMGFHEINWNAEDMSSGIYFLSLRATSVNGERNFYAVKKMILIK